MALSESTLNEIRAELGELHRVQVRVEERIKALEAILTPFDFSQFGLPFQANVPGNGHQPENETRVALSGVEATGSVGNLGLRQAILKVLAEIGPARAPQVAKELQARGFPTTGKTRFSTRVYNDLWRMASNEQIDSTNGEFSVK